MSVQRHTSSDDRLQLAIFRLGDVCVSVQDKMERFLATAALEKQVGVEATFTWLRRRGVRLCLLSDYDRESTLLVLRRLGWSVGEGNTVQEIVAEQDRHDDPVRLAIEQAGLDDPRYSFTVFDTPRLLQLSNAARVHFNLALCNGRHSYGTLAVHPHHAMLDSLLQLPDFMLQHLPLPNRGAGPQDATYLAEERAGSVEGGRSLGRSRLLTALPWLRLPGRLSDR